MTDNQFFRDLNLCVVYLKIIAIQSFFKKFFYKKRKADYHPLSKISSREFFNAS